MCVVNNNEAKVPWLSVCALVLLSISCSQNDKQEIDTLKVVVDPVSFATINEDFNSFGTAMYKTKNNISSLVDGTLTELYVAEGDTVKKGQALARLRNIQLEIQREQAENMLDAAHSALLLAQSKMREEQLVIESRLLSLEQSALHLEQLELEFSDISNNLLKKDQLLQIGGVTEASYNSLQLSLQSKQVEINILKKEREIASLGLRDYDLLSAGYEVPSNAEQRKKLLIELNTLSVSAEIEAAMAGLRSAEKNLDSVQSLIEELSVVSPVSGVVGSVLFEQGEYVSQNESLATVLDIAQVHAVFFIQERDISVFSIGTPVVIDVPSLSQTIHSTIHEISPIADPKSGNFTVKAEIQNIRNVIRPGMFVKCTIPRQTNSRYAFIKEESLVQKSETENAVFCVVNDFAILKPVEIYRKRDGLIWVLSGLSEGDMVINNPSPFLQEGQHVSF